MFVIKKDGTLEEFNAEKIEKAVQKSAQRMMINLSSSQLELIKANAENMAKSLGKDEIPIKDIHSIVERTLDSIDAGVAKSYRDYRNYKQDFIAMMDDVYTKSQSIRYIGDKSNANTDSALVATKRSLIFNELNKNLYRKFFMNNVELQAVKDGYIYVHDQSARLDTINCCIFDITSVLTGGFEMGNVWYNEPNTLDTAFDVLGDVILSTAAQQYGGFTVPELDTALAPYAEKSYAKYCSELTEMFTEVNSTLSKEELVAKAEKIALEKVQRDMEQGWQGIEYKLNTVGSSRGDYPFVAVTFGLSTSKFGKMLSKTILHVHANGQGAHGKKKPVLFPKLIFLFDKNLHGDGKPLEDVFAEALQCSSKTMYPDYLSLTGEGYVPSMYKQYGKVVSPMGCRAFLSPWFERGGMHPADDNDIPIFIGRFNMGVISLNLPMIYAKAQKEKKEFFDVLLEYLEIIRSLHKKTIDYLGHMHASVNPMGFCEGGFYGGHLDPDEPIRPLLKAMTISYGITALNELQQIYNGKSLVEDGEFALETMKYIQNYVDRIKEEDNILYAIYGTPAESLCGLQVQQFREKFGIVDGVSSREYVSNSFHCSVWEDISPVQKQDLEHRFWPYFNGGKIQYVRYPLKYNYSAIKTMVLRAMDMGFYEGVNLALGYCDDCGQDTIEGDICPNCGSKNLTKIDRMNGYLSFSRIHGDTRLNHAKMIEISERKSM